MKCKRCGAQYSAKELKCPYCGEPNSLGIHWKSTEENARSETENTRKRVRHSAPLYVIDQIWNVVIVCIVLMAALFIAIALVGGVYETLHNRYVRSTASVAEADVILETEDTEALVQYVKEHSLYWEDGYDKYTERVQIYQSYRNLLEMMAYFQQNEDWNHGETPRMYRIGSALYNGQYMLKEFNRTYGSSLEYPENQRYLEKAQQSAVAFLEGTFKMTQEDITRLVDANLYSDEEQDFIKLVCERRGWEYEEN